MRQLRRLLSVATTTALIGSSLALAAPARAATPDSAVNLGLTTVGDLLVDDAHSHVLVPERHGSALYVRDLEGNAVKTLSGLGGIDGLALTPDGTGIYAADETDHDIALIDASSLTITKRYDLGLGTCVRSVAPIGTRLWFSYSCSGNTDPGGIGVVDLAADGTPVALGQELTGDYSGGARLRTSPMAPGKLFIASSTGISEWDAGSGSLTKVASVAKGQADLALTPDGGHVVGATLSSDWHQSYATADLAEDGRYGDEPVSSPSQNGVPSAVAASSSGLIAAGAATGIGSDLRIYSADDALVRSYDFNTKGTTRVQPHGLAFDASGARLYVVTGDGNLRVLHVPGAADTSMSLTGPATAIARGKAFSLSGRLTSRSLPGRRSQ